MSLPPGQRRPASAAAVPNLQNAAPHRPPSALKFVEQARQAAQNTRIPEPGAWAYLPVVGPAWETAYDLQEGNYAGAALNAGMLAAEFSPIGPLRRVAKVLDAVHAMKRAPLLASSNTQLARMRKIEQRARDKIGNTDRFEVHHTIPMEGAAPTTKEARRLEGLWRNHPANLKILPKDIHHKVHHGFGNRYTDPLLKTWHGTNDVQKAAAASTGALGVDSWQNSTQPDRQPVPPAPHRGKAPLVRDAATERRPAVFDPKQPIEVRRTEQGFIISNRR